MMYAVMSDIHGNLYALEKVAEDVNNYHVAGIILLGDIIDYGMQSNEVVDYIKHHLQDKVICSIWGNHEHAILKHDYSRFSSKRGMECADYTERNLTPESRNYLESELTCDGCLGFVLDGMNTLAVHGSKEDMYWGSITPGEEQGDYSEYDLVLSGHSHRPHVFAKYYVADIPEYRDQHKVTFLNPGSVGQPRNHDPHAQYALIDTGTGSVYLRSVPYDVAAAMATYDGSVDGFYRDRLLTGV